VRRCFSSGACSAGKAERFKIIHPSKAIVTTAAALGLKNSDFSAEAGVRAV
jgi:hypothetical protein